MKSLNNTELQNEIVETFLKIKKENIFLKFEKEFLLQELRFLCENESVTAIVLDDGFSISFDTKEIILKNINLGEFNINIEILSSVHYALEVKALNPNPSSSNDKITHPNVEGNKLCLGEGSLTLEKALFEGRFYDAYELILTILNTVSESPYVHIDDWNGLVCKNCESVCSDEDTTINECNDCEEECCSDCGFDCYTCSYLFHESCSKRCDYCKYKFCSGCFSYSCCKNCFIECDRCGDNYVPDEISENGLCSDCENYKNCEICDKEFKKDDLDENGTCYKCIEEDENNNEDKDDSNEDDLDRKDKGGFI